MSNLGHSSLLQITRSRHDPELTLPESRHCEINPHPGLPERRISLSSPYVNSPPTRLHSRPAEVVAASRWFAPAALLALCLLPRAIMAWKVPGLCPDAILYIRLGKAFEAG